jgi:Heliorhodopsin
MADVTAVDSVAPQMGDTGRLRQLNVAMGALHLAQAVLMVTLSTTFAVPITAAFLHFDAREQRLTPHIQTLASVPIGPLVAAFLLLSALGHLLTGTMGVCDWYARNVQRGVNPPRWIEYAVSSSLMIVVIAMLAGIRDVVSLVLLFGVNTTTVLFGWCMERYNHHRERPDWLAFWCGLFAGALPWLAIGIYLVGAASAGAGRPPTFLYAIYASLFVFFNVFGLNLVLQHHRVGPWRRALFSDQVYMVLSLAAKSALAWQVFAGTLRLV